MHDNETSQGDGLARALRGDQAAFAEVFESYRGRLHRMIALRMDPRVQGRLDPADVLQEAYVEAARSLSRYAEQPKVPFYLWLRLLAGQRLAKAHREHLGAAMRTAQREVSIAPGSVPDLSTFSLAAQLAGSFTSASGHLIRDELRTQVQAILDQMAPHDREVLALRHFEEMTNHEAATVLGITEAAAKSRYHRALLRITEALEQVPDLLNGLFPPKTGKPGP